MLLSPAQNHARASLMLHRVIATDWKRLVAAVWWVGVTVTAPQLLRYSCGVTNADRVCHVLFCCSCGTQLLHNAGEWQWRGGGDS